MRLARVEGSFAIVNAAAVVDGTHRAIAIGGADPGPGVATRFDLERRTRTKRRSSAPLPPPVDACADAYDDLNGSADYRRAMARRLCTACLPSSHSKPATGSRRRGS